MKEERWRLQYEKRILLHCTCNWSSQKVWVCQETDRTKTNQNSDQVQDAISTLDLNSTWVRVCHPKSGNWTLPCSCTIIELKRRKQIRNEAALVLVHYYSLWPSSIIVNNGWLQSNRSSSIYHQPKLGTWTSHGNKFLFWIIGEAEKTKRYL